MKTPRILALSIAVQLATIITSHAQTWDGAGAGGGSLNWLVFDLIGGFVPHFGDTFQLFDFDPGQVSGSFDEITIADALPGDLAFDTSALSTTGQVTVIPEPGIGALLLSALALLGVRRRNF